MEKKEMLLQAVEKNAQELFAMACDIFDHPEIGGEEVYASGLLESYRRREALLWRKVLAVWRLPSGQLGSKAPAVRPSVSFWNMMPSGAVQTMPAVITCRALPASVQPLH